ncbi:MAG: hypothetical protein LBR96_01560 [Treponema sp.]|jgi:hypothetical protein|nr:hypothetical protein [Treponema sp.]
MTENVKLARLWYKFHRLSEGHKELVIKASEMLARQAAAVPEKGAAAGLPLKAGSKRKRGTLKKV